MPVQSWGHSQYWSGAGGGSPEPDPSPGTSGALSYASWQTVTIIGMWLLIIVGVGYAIT